MARAASAVAVAASALAAEACAMTPAPRDVPTWERPGLGGGIRPEMGAPQPGDPAPNLDLPTARGDRVRLASLRGSWVLLHFTATWCPYCDAEVEHLGELADAFAARGVRVLLVDIKEDPFLFASYARDHVAESVAPLFDADGTTAARWAPRYAQPSFTDRSQVMFDTTLLVDPGGTLRLFLFPDTAHFDPTFRAVREELDRLLRASGRPELPLLPPEQAVAIAAGPSVAIARGGDASASVDLEVAPGYHVMAAETSRANYVPARVTMGMGGCEGVATGDASYPAATSFHFDGRAIATFQGRVRISIPLHAAGTAAPGACVLSGSLRYQACTSSACLVPITKPIVLPAVVTP
jgi:peroxiredoxin